MRGISLCLLALLLSGCEDWRIWWQAHLSVYQSESAKPVRAHVREGVGGPVEFEYDLVYKSLAEVSQRVLSPEEWKNSGLYLRSGWLKYCSLPMGFCLELDGLPRPNRADGFNLQLDIAKIKISGYRFLPGPRTKEIWQGEEVTHMIATNRNSDELVQRIDFWQIPSVSLPIRARMSFQGGNDYASEFVEASLLESESPFPDPWPVSSLNVETIQLRLEDLETPIQKEGQRMALTKRAKGNGRVVDFFQVKSFYLISTDLDPDKARAAAKIGLRLPVGNAEASYMAGPALSSMIVFQDQRAKLLIGNVGLSQMIRVAANYFH